VVDHTATVDLAQDERQAPALAPALDFASHLDRLSLSDVSPHERSRPNAIKRA
jgi:hypothetical protein